MIHLLYSLPLLVCPIGMGLMMWFMRRGKGHDAGSAEGHDSELARLRAEVERLRSSRQASDSVTVVPGKALDLVPCCWQGPRFTRGDGVDASDTAAISP